MYNAEVNLVKDIRDYQISKGQEPLFGTWYSKCVAEKWFPNNIPPTDFLTTNGTDTEMLSPIVESRIENDRKSHLNIYPNIISMYYIDWPPPISVFAQCLTPEQQRNKLKEIKEIITKYGMIFAYPVHGAWMVDPGNYCPDNPIKKSYGLYPYYDSKAPEFDTYNTIKELTNPITKSSEAGIGPILILGLLAGGLYLYLKNREKEIRTKA